MKTAIDRIKIPVIIALDFFEIIDGFEEQGETDQPDSQKDNCEHFKTFGLGGQNGCRSPPAAHKPLPHAIPQAIPRKGVGSEPYQNEKVVTEMEVVWRFAAAAQAPTGSSLERQFVFV